jgi:hypothetical protein
MRLLDASMLSSCHSVERTRSQGATSIRFAMLSCLLCVGSRMVFSNVEANLRVPVPGKARRGVGLLVSENYEFARDTLALIAVCTTTGTLFALQAAIGRVVICA